MATGWSRTPTRTRSEQQAMGWLLLRRSGAQPSLGDDAQGRGVHGDAAQSLKLHRLVVLNKAYIRRPFAAKAHFELLAINRLLPKALFLRNSTSCLRWCTGGRIRIEPMSLLRRTLSAALPSRSMRWPLLCLLSRGIPPTPAAPSPPPFCGKTPRPPARSCPRTSNGCRPPCGPRQAPAAAAPRYCGC